MKKRKASSWKVTPPAPLKEKFVMFKIKGMTYMYSMGYINNLKSTVPSCFRIYFFRIYIWTSRPLFMPSGLNITPQDFSGTLTH